MPTFVEKAHIASSDRHPFFLMPPSPQLGLRANLAQFILLVVVNAFVGAMIGLERSVLPLLAQEKYQVASGISLLSFIAAFGVAKALSNYLTGYFSNRIGRKRLLLMGWVLALPVPFLIEAAPTWSWIVGANLLLGIHQGLAWSSTVVMKIDLVGEHQRGLAMGLNEFAGYVAVALAALGSAHLAKYYPVTDILLYGGLGIALTGLLLSAFWVRDTHHHVAAESAHSCKKKLPHLFKATTWQHPNLSAITQAGLVNNLNDGMVWGILPLLLHQKDYTLSQIGTIVGTYPMVWGLTQIFTGRWADHASKKQLLAAGMYLQALALGTLLLAGDFKVYWAASALLGLGTALVYPVFMAAIADNVHPQQRAESIGIFRLWRDSGYVFGALLTGLIMDWVGMEAAVGSIALLTALSALLLQQRMSDVPPCDSPLPLPLGVFLKKIFLGLASAPAPTNPFITPLPAMYPLLKSHFQYLTFTTSAPSLSVHPDFSASAGEKYTTTQAPTLPLSRGSAYRSALLLLVTLLLGSVGLLGQAVPFNLHLEPITIPNLGGLQSYAFGEYGGKWLIVGGRLDGLHRRQPFAAFDVAGHNNQLLVADPVTRQVWTASLSTLPAPLLEQMSATNMAFFQEGERLYIVGGYGYSASLGDHTTYGALMVLNLPEVIQAVLTGSDPLPYIRQVSDLGFTVTGGRLIKLYDTFYLVGGQNFQGRYNPMGPAHGPGFFQEYTNSVRRFRLTDNGTTLSVQHKTPWVNAEQLHRRDFNVVPQIMPNGQEGMTAFSGVFQANADLPYLNCVNIDSSGYQPHPTFQQYYNHYHCATLPLYDAAAGEMHSVFFGGIAQFYDSLGILVQDNNVPFVKTVARVTRTADGQMKEYKIPLELADYLGAGAEFIPALGIPTYANGVLKLDEIADQKVVGYIYGGIRSTAPNIFWVNDGTQSQASTSIYQVRLLKKPASGTHQLNVHSQSSLRVEVLPNPNAGHFEVRYQLQRDMPVTLRLTTLEGQTMEEVKWPQLRAGAHTYMVRALSARQRGLFLLTVETADEVVTRKVMIDP